MWFSFSSSATDFEPFLRIISAFVFVFPSLFSVAILLCKESFWNLNPSWIYHTCALDFPARLLKIMCWHLLYCELFSFVLVHVLVLNSLCVVEVHICHLSFVLLILILILLVRSLSPLLLRVQSISVIFFKRYVFVLCLTKDWKETMSTSTNQTSLQVVLPTSSKAYTLFFYKHCNFLAEAHLLLRYHEKEGSKFA